MSANKWLILNVFKQMINIELDIAMLARAVEFVDYISAVQ